MKTNKHFFQIQGFALGTTYNTIFESENADGIQDQIETIITAFEKSLSVYDPNSIISKINKGKDIEIDRYFSSIFSRAKEIYDETEGLFDISAEPLFKAWGFSFEDKRRSIKKTKIEELLRHVGMDKVELQRDRILKHDPQIQLNVNAIAKGYATDIIAEWFEQHGISNYLVEVGGEIRTQGVSPRGEGWIIGIDRPLDTNLIPGQDIQVLLMLTNKAIATSGNYRQFYIKEGKKISHTINPRTGYPVHHSLLSVTVVANDAMSADAYATAFLVAGIDKSLELLEQIRDVEVLFIADEEGEFKVHYTTGLEEHIIQ